MSTLTTPLFTLHTVLFPGGRLPLRVFEPRYLQMIGRCLKQDSGFGVCLIRQGSEVGEAAFTFDVGTLARIESWDRDSDGLLQIVARGECRFRVQSRWVETSQLCMAEVECLPADAGAVLPEHFRVLAELLDQVLAQAPVLYPPAERKLDDALWVSGRLTELLDLPLATKQQLLEMDTALERLQALFGCLGG